MSGSWAASRGLLSPLGNPAFRRLFAARSIALVGSGLTTIALSLLAYDLAGGGTGFVLGSAATPWRRRRSTAGFSTARGCPWG